MIPELVTVAEADPGFSFMGGLWIAKYCVRTHITSAEPNSLSAGVQGPLKGPGSSRVVLLRLGGGGAACCTPGSATVVSKCKCKRNKQMQIKYFHCLYYIASVGTCACNVFNTI